MFPNNSGPGSPTSQVATNISGVLLNQTLSESPASTSNSTPALDSGIGVGIDGDDTVPPLCLDDIQSAVSLNQVPEEDEISTTIAFPHDTVPSQVPAVTITTSTDRLVVSSTPINTPPLNTNDMHFIPGLVTLPHNTSSDLSPSTASSALTDGDKLTELPASFSAPRLQNLVRKAVEAAGMSAQESMSSSLKGQLSRRSIESDASSAAGTIPGKSRGDVTPKRVSFEGERILPGSPPLDGRASEVPLSHYNQKAHSSPVRSSSPFRNFLWPLHRAHSREEPFLPVDPYRLNIFPVPITIRHFFSQVICQLYRHLLLRLPSIYFTRVSNVFENAEVSRPEVQRMIDGRNKDDIYRWPADHEWVAPNVSPALIRFKESWESFVESVLKEWKTLNVVSALLLTCVVLLPIYARTKPEIEGASTAPVIRTTAFLSLVCALMSLIYGCIYILRFGTMRSMYRASRWAEEAQRATSIFWNVWVLLAMPAVWISWSMIFFCICILDFVWDQPFSSPTSSHDFARSGASSVTAVIAALSESDDDRLVLVPRILITCVFLLGVIYFILVVRTFRSWGDPHLSQEVRDRMETGKWTPRTPSPVPASPRPSRESRFSRRNATEIGDEEKSAMRNIHKERRTRSADFAMV